jgi:TonB family protein
MPELLTKNEPEYTEDARRAKLQGTVELMIVVGADGRVSSVEVVRGLGLGLDEKAVEAVKAWRFRPAMSDGKPVASSASVAVTFRLL